MQELFKKKKKGKTKVELKKVMKVKAVSWVRNAAAFPPDKPHAKCRGNPREASKEVTTECKLDACLGEEIHSQLPKQSVEEFMEESDMCPQDHGSIQDKDRDWCLPLICRSPRAGS